jgi:hypothetical protein
VAETSGQRWRRRLYHYGRHPWRWTRYLFEHEILHREVRFGDHPRFRDWRPMYRLCREDLARLCGRRAEELDRYFAELPQLHDALAREVTDLPAAGALWQAPLLYVVVRAMQPRWLIETGISSGYSSRFLLEALARNGTGHLDSIGLNELALGRTPEAIARSIAGRPVGWLVPERLHSLWGRHVGTSQAVLPTLLADRADPLDIFLHDSEHVFATMMAEYSTAFPRLGAGGWLLSHDIHNSAAWPQFLAEHHLVGDAELDHDLGAVRRPAAGS